MPRSREFRPGHPVLFWSFIVVLAFAMYSGAVAVYQSNDCDTISADGVKHWRVLPPGWICGPGDIQFTD